MIGVGWMWKIRTVEHGLRTKSLRLVVSIQLKDLFDLFQQFPEGFEIKVLIPTMTKDYSRYQKI